jgi:hypothetical protein
MLYLGEAYRDGQKDSALGLQHILDCLLIDPTNIAAHKYAIDAYLGKVRLRACVRACVCVYLCVCVFVYKGLARRLTW